MSEFSLLPGEEVIRRNDETAIGGPGRINLGIRKDSLILTNQSLICIKRGLLGKVKDVKRYSLSDIVIANGKPQVQSGRFDNVTRSLDIYLKQGELRVEMLWEEEILDWVDEITLVLTGHTSGLKPESDGFEKFSGEVLKVAENVDKAMGKFRKAFGIKSNAQASGKCPGCGAPITGTEGEAVQCPYCATYYTF